MGCRQLDPSLLASFVPGAGSALYRARLGLCFRPQAGAGTEPATVGIRVRGEGQRQRLQIGMEMGRGKAVLRLQGGEAGSAEAAEEKE